MIDWAWIFKTWTATALMFALVIGLVLGWNYLVEAGAQTWQMYAALGAALAAYLAFTTNGRDELRQLWWTWPVLIGLAAIFALVKFVQWAWGV